MIFVIEDDPVMAESIARSAMRALKAKANQPAAQPKPAPVTIFDNALAAAQALNHTLPQLIFLDILLTGPNGFTFLNEIVSYADTSQVPIVIISSLDFAGHDLSDYGVVGVLNKSTMTPQEIGAYVTRFTH